LPKFPFDDSSIMEDKCRPQIMFTTRLTILRQCLPAIGTVCVLVATGVRGFSDEPAQKSTSTQPSEKSETIPLPEPQTKGLLDYRAYRPSDSIFKSSGMNTPGPAMQMPSVPPPTPSKQDRELLDRQKNWIFLRPGDEKQASAEDIFGVGAATIDDGRATGLVARFLENKPSTEPNSVVGKPNALNGMQPNSFTPQVFGIGSANGNAPSLRAWDAPVSKYDTFTAGNVGIQKSLADQWQELHGQNSEQFREQKQARMSEFENLFGAPNISQGNAALGTPGFGALPNPLATPAPATPSLNQLDPFTRGMRPDSDGLSGYRNPARSLADANPLQQPSITARVFGRPAELAPAPAPTRDVSQPAILPIPKRHF
jgi:hypothetical protein